MLQIFAATTIIAVASRNCNGYYEDVDSRKDDGLRDGKMKVGVKTKKMKERGLALQKASKQSNTTDEQDKDSPDAPKRKNRCCPYDFDSTLCKIVDDRVLCGYNRNPGKPNSKDTVVEMHGGCRLRDGRLECGYNQGPFTNARRPPAWNQKTDVGRLRA